MKDFSITTRQGDEGRTRLFSGELVAKHGPRTEAYGEMDELSSVLGVARSLATRKSVAGALREVQVWLFTVNMELATSNKALTNLAERVDEVMLGVLDERCAAVEAVVPEFRGFVVAGGTTASAHIDHARTIARRAERRITLLHGDGEIDNQHLLAWINRLSDYLWLLARVEEGDRTDWKDAF